MPALVVRLYKGVNFPKFGSLKIVGQWGSDQAQSRSVSARNGLASFYSDLVFNVTAEDERLAKQVPVMLYCCLMLDDKTRKKLGSIKVDVTKMSKACKRYELQSDEKLSSPTPAINLCVFTEGLAMHEDDDCQDTQSELSNGLNLEPVLVNDEYFRVGDPSAEGLKFYTISLTLVFADNLVKVFPLEKLLPPKSAEFNFSTYLLGLPVIFHKFTDLTNALSVQERAYARVLIHPKDILDFLIEKLPYITLSFCCSSFAIAETKIPIGERLAQKEVKKFVDDRLKIEPFRLVGTYRLAHLFSLDSVSLPDAKGDLPVIGATVTIGASVPSELPASFLNEQRSPMETQNALPPSQNFRSRSPTLEAERKKMFYAMSLELELWKEEQMKIFEAEIAAKQKRQLELLNCEYLRQVARRDHIHKEKMKKCEEMEAQLAQAIQKAEDRERQCSRVVTSLHKEMARLCEEHAKTIEKMKSDFERQREHDRRQHSSTVNALNRKLQELRAKLQREAKKPKTEE